MLQTKNSPDGFKYIVTLSFHKMLSGKVTAIISLKMWNPVFQVFVEFSFSDDDHCIK